MNRRTCAGQGTISLLYNLTSARGAFGGDACGNSKGEDPLTFLAKSAEGVPAAGIHR
ncbi:hypothetical protein GLW04_15340 [Halobacillus litoralis]|uniref:Uncharacterized protein n=1 Tax=Halobacillus litoralis TaxID=45668 RepID=A0A845E6H6_9BACI|nr:hypothetical protein [Halobacillus litoralis]MYL21274.1 hypothetical protein [Halobacillus litoralis]